MNKELYDLLNSVACKEGFASVVKTIVEFQRGTTPDGQQTLIKALGNLLNEE